ncbi:MAG: homospermidine synthase, partial [Actinobacteria bacterium]|nr:homospermidine synthase [Actinomycetota bacterium]
VADAIKQGVKYEIGQVTRENLDSFLSERVAPGDILLDLAWNIDCPTILEWCRMRGVRYLNTSVELWDPYYDMAATHPLDRTLYVRHQTIRKMISKWGSNKGPSAVVEHGANPGLVSHFAKQALFEISNKILSDGRAGSRQSAIESALASESFDRLAMLTNEFVNTWSVEGFYEEGVAPAEMGWGTHERWMPANAQVHADDGPCNQICLSQPGMETWVRSWVPSGEILGMIIRHGESYTMSNHLTVRDESGKAIYRPTVHYSYCPSNEAINSVLELRMRNWQKQPKERIMNNEIISGRDELGVLLLGHDYTGWWTGTRLSIDEARSIVDGQSATTLQVAGSVIAAVKWMNASPNQGVCVPDDLPWQSVLADARPYIGEIHS